MQKFEGISVTSSGLILKIHVKPSSRENKLILDQDGMLTMHVISPPREGKANRELVRWLSKKLRKSTSEVKLIGGLSSNVKTILVVGDRKEDIMKIVQTSV